MAYQERTGEEIAKVNEPDMSRSYTAGEYLQWTFEGLYELIRGKVFKMSPAPSSDHQKVSRNLTRKLLPHFPPEASCEFYYAPLDVFLVRSGESWKETKTVVQPDLCIICDKRKIKKQGCIGAPDFVLEILSTSTGSKDFREKFQLYEEYGVPEYWIVDPFTHSVTRNILKGGKYEIQRTNVAGDHISPKQFPDLKIEVSEVFEGVGME